MLQFPFVWCLVRLRLLKQARIHRLLRIMVIHGSKAAEIHRTLHFANLEVLGERNTRKFFWTLHTVAVLELRRDWCLLSLAMFESPGLLRFLTPILIAGHNNTP